MSRTDKKTKQLWRIFFDDGNAEPEVTPRGSRQAESSHGVLYQGLLDAESDSEEEVEQRSEEGQRAPSGGDPADASSVPEKETVFYEKSVRPTTSNGVENYKKPYNANEWESVDITPNTSQQKPRPLLQHGGARYIIRSESDLELAIPSNERAKRRCCCFPEKGSQPQTFEYYACIILALVAMSAVYVAIVIGIVYGFK